MRGETFLLLTAACDVLIIVKRKTQQIIKQEFCNNFGLFMGTNCLDSFELPFVISFVYVALAANRGHLGYTSKLRQLK